MLRSCWELTAVGKSQQIQRSFPRASLHGCGVVDLAHEEDALCGMLQDEDQEGPVEYHDFRHTHGHDFKGGGGCRLRSRFVHGEHSLVGHLWRNREEEVSVRFCP